MILLLLKNMAWRTGKKMLLRSIEYRGLSLLRQRPVRLLFDAMVGDRSNLQDALGPKQSKREVTLRQPKDFEFCNTRNIEKSFFLNL